MRKKEERNRRNKHVVIERGKKILIWPKNKAKIKSIKEELEVKLKTRDKYTLKRKSILIYKEIRQIRKAIGNERQWKTKKKDLKVDV